MTTSLTPTTTQRPSTTPMRRGYLDVTRGQLHYRSAGIGPTTVVLLHQTASSGAMYEAFVAAALAAPDGDDFTFVAFDTPGFGMSFRPAEHYDIGDFAVDFTEGLDALGVESFHVLGHHTGVAIAARLGATLDERVESVTMFGPLGLTREQNRGHFEAIHPIVYDETGAYLLEVWNYASSAPVGDPTRPSLALHHREVVDKLRAGDRFHEAYEAVFTTDVGADLAAVTAPLLLLTSTADALDVYREQTVAAHPDMLVAVLDAGVYVIDQDPDLVLSAIRDHGVWSK